MLLTRCAAPQWVDLFTEAGKAVVILFILERLYLTSNARWLEEHIDYIGLQSLLVKRQGLSLKGQIQTFWRHQKRLSG